MKAPPLLALYEAMFSAREVDHREQQLTLRGEAYFHVSGAGHEGSAALGPHLLATDWLHCHYRDKALLLYRGLRPIDFFGNVLVNEYSSSNGRRMSAFFSQRELNVLSMVTPTGNNALQSVGVAAACVDAPEKPIVYCGVGDGTTQQGEFLEAVGEAVRSRLPVLFFVHNNRLAISTRTEGKTCFSLPSGEAQEVMGLPVHFLSGIDIHPTYERLGEIVGQMRETRQPAFVVMEMERLADHTNADDQSRYRSENELRDGAERDPLQAFRKQLAERGISEEEIQAVETAVRRRVSADEGQALSGETGKPMNQAVRPLSLELTHPSAMAPAQPTDDAHTMRDALRSVLQHRLKTDSRIVLLGEDIEDPKGDVFGVTRGLSTQYPGRVLNSALSESTIVGTSVGRALGGQRPVAFIQFADFLPLAFNQIATELSTIFWRTDGEYEAPMVIMAACGAYRPGLGPYHAQTMESSLLQLPGIDVFMPYCADDASGILNAALDSERPSIILYPKAVLNDPKLATQFDPTTYRVPIGVSRKVRAGRDITLVGWGNTVRICEQTAEELLQVNIEAEVIDLRSLSPWDDQGVVASAEKTARLLVVHEDNQTCGLGGEILATVAERARVPVAMRRIARTDSLIPCDFESQQSLLPSLTSTLEAAAEMLNLQLEWQAIENEDAGTAVIEAIGSGPADETVDIVQFYVEKGQRVEAGDTVAELEATKSVFELSASVGGTVLEICVDPGDTVDVGSPLIRLQVAEEEAKKTSEEVRAVLTKRRNTSTVHIPQRHEMIRRFEVGLSQVAVVTGNRQVGNDIFPTSADGLGANDIVRRTGIQTRQWVDDSQEAISMAVEASWEVLQREGLSLDQIDVLICSTTTPTTVTPSVACRILNGLSGSEGGSLMQAYDINAACSGYLYGLQSAYDYLQSTPTGRVLLVTSEVLSPLLDPKDFDTAILFGDATTATVIYGEEHIQSAAARLQRPEVTARGEDGSTLSVPFQKNGFIQMKGRKVFTEAVRSMITSLNRVCEMEQLDVSDLRMVVPHQANQRIMDAIQNRIKIDVYSNIQRFGNTSSSSIPLCLNEVLPKVSTGDQIGLCAFGGGFTFGAGILKAC